MSIRDHKHRPYSQMPSPRILSSERIEDILTAQENPAILHKEIYKQQDKDHQLKLEKEAYLSSLDVLYHERDSWQKYDHSLDINQMIKGTGLSMRIKLFIDTLVTCDDFETVWFSFIKWLAEEKRKENDTNKTLMEFLNKV